MDAVKVQRRHIVPVAHKIAQGEFARNHSVVPLNRVCLTNFSIIRKLLSAGIIVCAVSVEL